MATRGGRGWGGDKSARFMMVAKDNSSTGAKTGVVAPVPFNTPSLRQEIHGSLGDNAAIASINRSSAGGGWGSAAGAASASAGNPDQAGGGKGRGRGVGGSRSQGGDDVFTRHFPDLRAGLEQAERLDAETKASSKVAPIRKPKPEPAKDHGPSLRPRAMLKPTGSAGGGSAATAAAQAAIKDAVHNRVATTLKPEERRRNTPSFADEIGTKSRWAGGRPPSQEAGGRGRGGGRGGGGRGGGGAWDTNRDGGRERGGGGPGYDRERGTRGDAFQDKDRRSFTHASERVSDRGSDRPASNSRGRESIFGAGAHVGMANSNQDGTSGGTKTLATTYVRQHGPPPRKATTQGASTPVQQEQPPATQQPTRSAAYSASARSGYASEAEASGTSTETSKWRPASSPSISTADAPEVSTTLESCSSQSGSYVRTHGPPRRSGREGQGDEQGGGGRGCDAGEEGNPRFGGSWAPEQSRGVADRDSVGSGERTLSGRWKEPASSLAPPPAPTNTRWKEPKEEPSVRRWKGREEVQMGSGRWGRSVCDQDDVDSGNVAHVAQSSPSQGSSWKEEPADEWGLPAVEHEDVEVVSSAAVGHLEQQADDASSQHDEADAGVAAVAGDPVDAVVVSIDASGPPSTTAEGTSPEDPASFRSSFVQQPAAATTAAPVAQPVLRNASWEPQLPTSSGGASQPWGDPWGTPGFSLSANNDQGSSAMASFLGNGPGDARKDRHLPPALRNRTPSEGNQGDASTVSSIDQEADKISKDVSTQDLVMPGAGGGMATVSPGCGTDAKAPLYEQQQAPLEEWQQGEAQAPHRAAQDQAAHPVEPELHQRQPIHQSHQVQPAQPLHLHNQPHLDHEYRPSPAAAFPAFQPQDRHKHQVQEPALHQFQPDHFRTQPYHNQDQPGRAPIPEHIHLPHFPPEHAQQRQQFSHVQQHPHQQMNAPQHGMQQQPPQPQQQHQQQQQQQGHQQQHGMHAHQQGHQQLPPPPLGNQVAHHPRHQPVHAQQRNHHHQQQDMGRQTSQSQQQQIHMQHQQQQHMQQSSAFMMPSPAIGYADPRGARGGGLGGLPIQMAGSYHELPQQSQSGMPPPGAYGFQSPETHHKR